MPAPERPIVAFFASETCGHSRRMDSVIEHFARLHRDTVRIAKVVVEERPDLAARFDVTEAPTILLLDSVTEVARLTGRQTLPMIREALEPLLEAAPTPEAALA